jgi:hypothetical protein
MDEMMMMMIGGGCYFSIVLINQGVNVNEISTPEIAVTITLPYCLNSSPLNSLTIIIVKVNPINIVQYFKFIFSFSILFFGN